MSILDRPISPEDLLFRDREWNLLSEFTCGPVGGNRLAVVYGRRRQGKSTLLQELAAKTHSFYWEAAEQSSAQNLASFSSAWTLFVGSDGPIRFQHWEEALEVTLKPQSAPFGYFIDEVGYLINTAPEFPSLLQRHLGPKASRQGSARVVLCGSIYAQMTGLLAAGKPLRGRHQLVIDVAPFSYRESADFWGLADNPDAAFRLHALIGGTPAYLRYVGEQRPARGNIDRWVVEHLLDQSSPLFREGQILVAEDPTLVDKSLYWSVLGAVADGHRRRNDIARALDRSPAALAQALTVLSAGRWIEMAPDPFHERSTTVLLTDPIVRTHRVLIAPESRRLQRGMARAVWEDSQHNVARLIYAPHLEWMANEWVLTNADSVSVGGSVRGSGPGVLRHGSIARQLDIVAVSADRNNVDRVCAIGEVKAEAQPMGNDQLQRLDDIAGLLGKRAAPSVRRLLVARGGFTAELRRAARARTDLELIDMDRLYNQS